MNRQDLIHFGYQFPDRRDFFRRGNGDMRVGPARLIARTAGMLMTLSPSQFERANQNAKWLQRLRFRRHNKFRVYIA